jgi:hypothetical protein
MEPIFCPYCGLKRLEELDPTEIMVDNDIWIIYHYECQECAEIFDKILLKDEGFIDDFNGEEDEKGFWS